MRRMMVFLVGVSLLSMLAGCNCFHSHGICDCEDDDHCSSRSPWIRGNGMPAAESMPAPEALKLPDGKKL
jgi:hypothetical protein